MEPPKTFLTEANIPVSEVSAAAKTPAAAVAPVAPQRVERRPQAVRNIYEYPSVQNLKCEVGLARKGEWRFQVPWRFQRGDLGDGLQQGPPRLGPGHRRPAPVGNKNTRQRNVVWHGTASLLGKANASAEAAAAMAAQRPPAIPHEPLRLGPPETPAALPPPTPLTRSALSAAESSDLHRAGSGLRGSGRRSSASMREQLRHQVSVVGSMSGDRLPSTSSQCASTYGCSTRSGRAPLSRTRGSSDAPAIPGKPHVLVPLRPPPAGAPPPLPEYPPGSEVADSILAEYENMTSVSQRTPQTQTPSRSGMRYSAGLAALEEGLRRETSRKVFVEQELGKLRERQERLFAQLLPHEREELSAKMRQEGMSPRLASETKASGPTR
eukprot:TRINITY_DN30870_c0_g1_i1.p1 TRINITY_DN30870_c0_g1~~TRINITY_DN30870_c0_g1_i1.p1  ORF type:complete len:381 (+),score=56.17 TRINITY_DN30870_c0_g1_i1:54-1196(+)